jgi:TolB protein
MMYKANIRNFFTSFTIFLVIALISLIGCNDDWFSPPETLPVFLDEFPAWSPDGKWIAYFHEVYNIDSTYPEGLYLIDSNGNNRRLLVPGFASAPDWSPDGNRIAFNGVHIINLDTDSIMRVAFGGLFPCWSPDGNAIVCDRSGSSDIVGSWIIDLTTGAERRLGAFGIIGDWSGYNNKFVYSGASGNSQSASQVWTMDTSGANRTQLTHNSFVENRYPKWSSKGSMITWTVIKEGLVPTEIWIMESNGMNQRKLMNGYHSAWSPNSTTIVFGRVDSAKTKINLWSVHLDGTNFKQITH